MTNRQTPVAIADVTAGRVMARVEIKASPERVFQALSDPAEIVQWWGGESAYRTTHCTSDFQVGGAWRSEGIGADGTPYGVGGEYLAIQKPSHIVQSWRPDWDGGHETTLTYLIEAIEGGVVVTIRHDGFGDKAGSCASHAAGWELVLDWLQAFVAPAPDMQYFLCRLLPPRPTFAADMTADERDVMRAHGGYWRHKLQEGVAIVFGPVADPKGAWGIGLVRVPDEASVAALRANDPAILSGMGFSYEVLPMVTAVH
jgi:uncharacterized protein YndB with AHSA1/START domain